MSVGKKSGIISAAPVKSFFVNMLTRDIELKDAILDLLDNCVDGIQRSCTKKALGKKRPYDGYRAKITLSGGKFVIEDNCGGISEALLDDAFRMGRVDPNVDKGRKTVGIYGIGMKRAIFKLGRECEVTTHAKDVACRVHFSPKWMEDSSDWDLPIEYLASKEELGTRIEVTALDPNVSAVIAEKEFHRSFCETVSTHYAYIIQKGFSVSVNGHEISPKPIKLLMETQQQDSKRIEPFVFQTEYEGVSVWLSVGFTQPLLSQKDEEGARKNNSERRSADRSGWTVICNDRTILYHDKEIETGWGTSGVPRFHYQFIPIAGVVVFDADDASKLPTTTTKRGIEMSSKLYLLVRDKMIEGMKLFTQYTNQWKGPELLKESKKQLALAESKDVRELRSSKLAMASTRGELKGTQHKPDLPKPSKSPGATRRIAFTRTIKDIETVSEYLLGKRDGSPTRVGEACFNAILEEAKR